MKVELVNKIKRLAIIALASDDELVESIVLKGGNAIDLAYNINSTSRTSYDLDYSIEDGVFNEDEDKIAERIKNTLEQTFSENDFIVIDYKFLIKPKNINPDVADFWGGYKVEFKIIDKKTHDENFGNVESIRRRTIALNTNNSTVFELEFSKYEFVSQKKEVSVDGYKIYVYTPEMIVFEKVRAICQQIPEYGGIIPSFTPRARARDFYDIFYIMETHPISPGTKENIDLIENVFRAKKVPVHFIKKIRANKNIHLDDWKSVKDTVSAKESIQDFDFYFDFVLQEFEGITFP